MFVKLTGQLRTTPDRFLLFYTGYFFEEFPKGFWTKGEKHKRTVNNLTKDIRDVAKKRGVKHWSWTEKTLQQILPSYEDYSSMNRVCSGPSGLSGSKTKDDSVFITRDNRLAIHLIFLLWFFCAICQSYKNKLIPR